MAIALSAKVFSVSAFYVWNSLLYCCVESNCRSAELFRTFDLPSEVAFSKCLRLNSRLIVCLVIAQCMPCDSFT